jgi:hypothetical protein
MIALNEVSRWCRYRNEVVHAMMTKSYESIESTIHDQVEIGYGLHRQIDACVSQIKKNNQIRKKLNIQ